jgi:hypothetical protein
MVKITWLLKDSGVNSKLDQSIAVALGFAKGSDPVLLRQTFARTRKYLYGFNSIKNSTDILFAIVENDDTPTQISNMYLVNSKFELMAAVVKKQNVAPAAISIPEALKDLRLSLAAWAKMADATDIP